MLFPVQYMCVYSYTLHKGSVLMMKMANKGALLLLLLLMTILKATNIEGQLIEGIITVLLVSIVYCRL